MSAMIVLPCEQCGEPFETRRSRPGRFCSAPCRNASQRLPPAERARRRALSAEQYRERQRAEVPDKFASRQSEASKRYRANHPERSQASKKKWRNANREASNATRRAWRSKNLVRALVNEARSRAKSREVEFSITTSDVPPMGTHCPLLGHPFPAPSVRRTPFSPSLDRIDPTRGYVPGNVWVVGYRANLIKNDGTAEEHEAIARAMRAALTSAPCGLSKS